MDTQDIYISLQRAERAREQAHAEIAAAKRDMKALAQDIQFMRLKLQGMASRYHAVSDGAFSRSLNLAVSGLDDFAHDYLDGDAAIALAKHTAAADLEVSLYADGVERQHQRLERVA